MLPDEPQKIDPKVIIKRERFRRIAFGLNYLIFNLLAIVLFIYGSIYPTPECYAVDDPICPVSFPCDVDTGLCSCFPAQFRIALRPPYCDTTWTKIYVNYFWLASFCLFIIGQILDVCVLQPCIPKVIIGSNLEIQITNLERDYDKLEMKLDLKT